MTNKKTLTNTAIEALQPGDTVWDVLVPGLHIRTSLTRKSFYLYFRTKAGQERRPKVGDVGIITLAQARDIAREQLAVVAAGGDPIMQREVSQGEPTVTDFFERCWREHFGAKKDHRNVRRIFDARVKPRLGNHRVRALCYADIVRLHAALAPTPYEANRTLALVSKMLNLAERYGERATGSNPCRHVARYPELSRRRFANSDELAKIGAEMDARWKHAQAQLAAGPLERDPGWSPTAARQVLASLTFLGLMIYTGMRPGEIAGARREWIERLPTAGVLRLPDSKTGQRDVYLPVQALELIDAFPVADGTLTGIQYPRTTWERIREAAGCSDVRLYDLRRTFATVSLAGGHHIGLIGEVLGHKTAQTTKIYARLMDDAAHGLVGATGDKMQQLLGG